MKKLEENKYAIRFIFSTIFFVIYYYLPFLKGLDVRYSFVFLVLGLVYLCSAIEGIVSK